MSAYVSLIREDCIQIASDGAMYTAEGRLMAVMNKVMTIPDVPMAVFGRGSEGVISTFSHTLNIMMPIAALIGRATFDDVVDLTESRLAPKVAEKIQEQGGFPKDEGHSEIILAGFSQRHGPCVAVARTFGLTIDYGEDRQDRMEPWKFYMLQPFHVGGPDLSPEEIAEIGLSWEALGRDGLRPYALPIMEAMRARKDINPTAPHLPAIHGVGGHVQYVTITRDEVRSEIIHTWPDVVGEMIDPHRAAA